jgi:peptidoglycan hydrolase-like protein with peptidoglycan-binding domain
MPLVSRRFASDSRLQAAAENSPPLRFGATGPAVAKMQDALVDVGFPMPITTANGSKTADGIWGQETSNTVRQFQLAQSLAADSVAGRDTLGRLDALIRAREDARLIRNVRDASACSATTARRGT